MQQSTVAYFAAVSILAATAAVVQTRAGNATDVSRPFASFPETIDGWRAGPSRVLSARVVGKLAATDYVDRTYTRAGSALDLFAAYYAEQQAGQGMHSPRNCLPGAGWEIWKYETVLVTAGGRSVEINKIRVQNGGERRIVFYWYQTPGRVIANEYASKAFVVWDGLSRGRRDGSIIRLTVADHEEAAAAAVGFASQLIPELSARLVSAQSPAAQP